MTGAIKRRRNRYRPAREHTGSESTVYGGRASVPTAQRTGLHWAGVASPQAVQRLFHRMPVRLLVVVARQVAHQFLPCPVGRQNFVVGCGRLQREAGGGHERGERRDSSFPARLPSNVAQRQVFPPCSTQQVGAGLRRRHCSATSTRLSARLPPKPTHPREVHHLCSLPPPRLLLLPLLRRAALSPPLARPAAAALLVLVLVLLFVLVHPARLCLVFRGSLCSRSEAGRGRGGAAALDGENVCEAATPAPLVAAAAAAAAPAAVVCWSPLRSPGNICRMAWCADISGLSTRRSIRVDAVS